MDTASTTYRIKQCSKCLGNTEYHCESCLCDLCSQCKESHVKDLQTIDHNVVSHREKFNNTPIQEYCVDHSNMLVEMYCELCDIPVCFYTTRHKYHRKLDIRTIHQRKRQQHRGTIHNIRSESLFYRPVLLTGIKADVKTCHKEISFFQSEMLAKAYTMKDLIDKLKTDFKYNVFCVFDFKHRCLKQKIEMINHIVSLQRYEHSYIQPAFTFSALHFLSSIKKAISQIHLTLHTSQLSMTEPLNKEDVIESLSAILITERRGRLVGKQSLLKRTSAEFHQSLTLKGVNRCHHISPVTSDQAWISDDENNIILTNTTGVPLHRLEDSCRGLYEGSHTTNSEHELIYIDMNYDINKHSTDMKTTTTFIKIKDSTWEPRCVHWSPFTGDLLVGMYREEPRTGKVTRYIQSGQLTQTMQHDNTGIELFKEPRFITENNNGDVVVSDSGAVVVTEYGGRHRFSYTGHPSGSRLRPYGICTDALSHILVCDDRTNTVQMLDQNGQFLSHLLIRPSGIFSPHSLGYDFNTHRLWVGSRSNNRVVIYRYITRHDALTDQNPATADVIESLSNIQTTETDTLQQGHQCLLKLMSHPKSLQSFTVIGVDRCHHISCVLSDRVWVSDYRHNLILTDITGVPLHRVEDSCSGYNRGLHTVNNESELIYIDVNYNINKLSQDIKTITTFIQTTDSTWQPQCVYWSPSSNNLLVALYREKPGIGKVIRYNQKGQLTQTIQHNNTGLALYCEPNYITENNNGDVVVSDYVSGSVVVTKRGGRHRFSYTGHPSGSELGPRGICTDAMSHILVCDDRAKEVQIIDRDGQFLSQLLIRPSEKFSPHSLSYDVNTHRLWVGYLYNNRLVTYRYITKQDALADEHTPRPCGEAKYSSTSAVEWK